MPKFRLLFHTDMQMMLCLGYALNLILDIGTLMFIVHLIRSGVETRIISRLGIRLATFLVGFAVILLIIARPGV